MNHASLALEPIAPPDDQAGHDDVPALRKGLALLDLLRVHGALTMLDVQRLSGLNRTMTFRLLRALVESGYVAHDPDRHHYTLGLRLLELGAAVTERLDLATLGRPLLVALREETRETVNLGVLEGSEIVYVAMEEGPLGLRMSARPGGRDQLHSTSLGKAILAFLSDEERAGIIASLGPLPRLTGNTITVVAALQRDLALVRSRGYALDDEENEIGARCVGVPVLDGAERPLAGLSVSGPVGRIDLARAERIAALLWEASRELSRRMGQSPFGV